MPIPTLPEAAWRNLLKVAPLRPLALQHYRNQFDDNTSNNLFSGLFSSFEQALAHAGSHQRVGYDNAESANLPYTSSIQHWDYPVMFWLSRFFEQGLKTVFDLGGHTGIKYYAFRRAIAYPDELRWRVCDVPAVTQKGQEMAHERDPEQKLSFTNAATDMKDHDILLASGSLQYLPQSLAELLTQAGHLPRKILINITPIHPDRTFFTLNHIGSAVCPYRVQARAPFIASIRALGYTRSGEWEVPGKELFLPQSPQHSIEHYSGFCFEREDPH